MAPPIRCTQGRSHGERRDSDEEPEQDLPRNLDDLLAGDLADLIDHYSGAYLSGHFGSSDINELINRYTARSRTTRASKLARADHLIAQRLRDQHDAREAHGRRTTSGSQSQNLVSRLIPNLNSFLP